MGFEKAFIADGQLQGCGERLVEHDSWHGGWSIETGPEVLAEEAPHVLVHLIREGDADNFADTRALSERIVPRALCHALRLQRWSEGDASWFNPKSSNVYHLSNNLSMKQRNCSLPYEAFRSAQRSLADFIHEDDRDLHSCGQLLIMTAGLGARQAGVDLVTVFDEYLASREPSVMQKPCE